MKLKKTFVLLFSTAATIGAVVGFNSEIITETKALPGMETFTKSITLDLNGGIGGSTSVNVTMMHAEDFCTSDTYDFYSSSSVNVPTKEGATFLGYFCNYDDENPFFLANGTTQYSTYATGLTVPNKPWISNFDPNFTLTAKWEENEEPNPISSKLTILDSFEELSDGDKILISNSSPNSSFNEILANILTYSPEHNYAEMEMCLYNDLNGHDENGEPIVYKEEAFIGEFRTFALEYIAEHNETSIEDEFENMINSGALVLSAESSEDDTFVFYNSIEDLPFSLDSSYIKSYGDSNWNIEDEYSNLSNICYVNDFYLGSPRDCVRFGFSDEIETLPYIEKYWTNQKLYLFGTDWCMNEMQYDIYISDFGYYEYYGKGVVAIDEETVKENYEEMLESGHFWPITFLKYTYQERTLESISASLTDSSKTLYSGDELSASDLTVVPTYSDGDGTPITDGTGVTLNGETSLTLEEGNNNITVSYSDENGLGPVTTTLNVNAEHKLTAEELAAEFNDKIDLSCNGGINPKLVGENSVSSAWATASEQYKQLSDEEKAKFNVSGSSSTTISDLTGYTWVPNDTISWPGAITYNVNATLYSEGGDEDTTEILKFYTQRFPDAILRCLGVTNGSSNWYTFAITGPIYQLPSTKGCYMGTSNQFKQMIFTGGADATNATLIEWLQANGTLTKETPEADPEIQEFLNKYDYLYQRYGNNTEMNLDNFLERDITPNEVRKNMLSVTNIDNSTWIIVTISLIGLTAVGFFVFYKKRKEN